MAGYGGLEVADDASLKVPGVPRGERTLMPVSISVSDPMTLILLLSSPEDYVFHMAALALGAYAELAAENRKFVVTHGGLAPTVARLKATLALPAEAQMAAVLQSASFLLCVTARDGSARRAMVKLDVVEPLATLLKADDIATLENATLALTALSRDYATAAAIVSVGGIPALLNLAQLPDQELAYYATVALGNCAAEYNSRRAIMSVGGIPILLSLLASETPNLRLAAARAIARLTKEFSNRVALRTADGLPLVLQFLGDPSLSFLAPYLAATMAACLEEQGTLEAHAELGYVQVLLTVLATSTAAGTLAQASLALARVCNHEPARSVVLHHDAFGSVVVNLLNESTDTTVLAHLAQLILNCATTSANCTLLRELGAIPGLVALLRHFNPVVHATALAAIAAFALHYENRSALRHADGLQALVAILDGGRQEPSVIRNAADALTSMCQEHESRSILQALKIMPILLASLKAAAEDAELVAALTRAIAGMAHEETARDELTTLSGVDLLVPLLSSESAPVRRDAAWAISVCCAQEMFAQQVCNRGGIDQLQNLIHGQGSDRERAHDTLAQLLKKNFSAKYALTSKLGWEDVIPAGFYDMGRSRRFQPLAELRETKLNSKREVLLVNPLKDKVLGELITRAIALVEEVPERTDRIAALAAMVADAMGGPKDWLSYNEFGEYEYELSALKVACKSNVIPLGAVTKGVFYHRALLFKILADNAKISATLERGEYTRAWNVVRVRSKPRIVDLTFDVGALYVVGTEKAERYAKI
ncbi:armadillo repeat-containing protein 3 [Thecamonas trahens ATCC 50062]|uniref:Armadillo repeat-containing protein 3 n=1 Tax=Thecamonas trahens ATCC 50062 TaxID=461836 RepID=A0A0L0D8I2_THETB|nr:armadillo repeat-containing protein 3 [Thecamonas trahens ATCC 50062]KNC47588.1 armadillo repeat-containing protein 3 [Thecamonas trahens ATCC 50062]|eukprot:XP_013759518.1 armadillo repeat-containing protein 3 [Thecamonas trahens ATCC 50062]